MKSRVSCILTLWVLACLMAAGAVRADFDLVGRMPAPGGHGWLTFVTGLASDGENLLVAVSRPGSASVYLVSPETGEVLKSACLPFELPGCPGLPLSPISAAYEAGAGRYWLGDLSGRFISFTWAGDDAVEVESCFDPEDLLIPSGLDLAGGETLYALDALRGRLVELATSGEILHAYDLPGFSFPTGLASWGSSLFATAVDAGTVYEMTREAELVETHALGGLTGCWGPTLHSAAFHGGLLYVGGSEDSISIFALSDSGIVIPEGDSVAVGIPGELEFTFESVTDSGLLFIEETASDPCPAPAGVNLFPEFYEVNTDAFFEFVVEVAVIDSVLPAGVPPEKVRVFTRPSGPCGVWRDATVEYVEQVETLKINQRTRSEDDEFSWFAIAEDNRAPADVVHLKFEYLRGHIESGQDSNPPGALAEILAALEGAEAAYCSGRNLAAREFLDHLEGVVRHNPDIPHTFDPDMPGTNLAGRIISRAHTLAFSMRYSADTALMSTAVVDPALIHAGIPGGLLCAVVEVPEGLDAYEVDPDCVYMEGLAQCIPGSISVADHDDDGDPEVRAMFYQGDVEEAFDETGPATVLITCFIEGYEVRAIADVEVVLPEVRVLEEGMLEGGGIYHVTWPGFGCGSGEPYSLTFSEDGGDSWQTVFERVDGRECDWLVPQVDTEQGILRVSCVGAGGEQHSAYSGLLVIVASAGVEDTPAKDFRLALSPNPATAGLTVELASPVPREAAVEVYSVTGELVKTLFRGRVDRGVSRFYWQGDNSSGRRVSPGTYFVLFRGDEVTLSEKVVIQR